MTGEEALKMLNNGWIQVVQLRGNDEESTNQNIKAQEAFAYIIALLKKKGSEMITERNCQSCEYYKDEYCENLELKPCYPQKGCDDFTKRDSHLYNEIKLYLEDHPISELMRLIERVFYDEFIRGARK